MRRRQAADVVRGSVAVEKWQRRLTKCGEKRHTSKDVTVLGQKMLVWVRNSALKISVREVNN